MAARCGFRPPAGACSQGQGSMITERSTDGQRTPCRILKPCILAGRSLPSFAGPRSDRHPSDWAESIARLRRKLNDHDGSYRLEYRLGVGTNGTSTRLNDE